MSDDFSDNRLGSRRLGALVPRLTKHLGQRRGGVAHLALAWNEIVGAELARQSQPEQISGGKNQPATLRIRAAAAAAFELQHRSDEILALINGYLGYQAVTRLAFVQAPVGKRRPPPAPPLDPASQRLIEARAASVADPALRTALERLGAAIARHDPGKKPRR